MKKSEIILEVLTRWLSIFALISAVLVLVTRKSPSENTIYRKVVIVDMAGQVKDEVVFKKPLPMDQGDGFMIWTSSLAINGFIMRSAPEELR